MNLFDLLVLLTLAELLDLPAISDIISTSDLLNLSNQARTYQHFYRLITKICDWAEYL